MIATEIDASEPQLDAEPGPVVPAKGGAGFADNKIYVDVAGGTLALKIRSNSEKECVLTAVENGTSTGPPARGSRAL